MTSEITSEIPIWTIPINFTVEEHTYNSLYKPIYDVRIAENRLLTISHPLYKEIMENRKKQDIKIQQQCDENEKSKYF